ncbi:MAG TPA: tetratricopeptide repeat protein [Longimicrobiaceae bacterium]
MDQDDDFTAGANGAGEQDHGQDSAAEVVAEAESLGAEERWDEARELLLEALPDHEEDALLLCWLGISSERLGDEGEAYEFFRRALAQQPVDPFILAAAGTGVAMYDDPEAESALRLAAITAPQFPFARSAYGSYLAREGLFEEALRELGAARDLAPDDAAVRAELGVTLLLAGKADAGVAELEEALSRSDEPWLRGLYGLALLETERRQEGAEELHRASSERPEDMEIHLLSALASAAEGWEDEAWAAVARAESVAEALDTELIREVEEAVEEGPEAARELLREQLGPSLLRERLHQRS